MEFPLYNQDAQSVGTIELADGVFGVPMNKDLLYQVTTSQIANKRQVIAHAKGRSEVRGGGKKPWQQKGTGRARHGSIRSPIWKGGGVTHGPTKERNFKKKLNKKMVQTALRVALSSKARDKQLVIIDQMNFDTPKTKQMAATMKKFMPIFGKLNSILLIMPGGADAVFKSARNLPYLDTIEAGNLNPLSVLSSTYLVMSKDALSAVEKQWSRK